MFKLLFFFIFCSCSDIPMDEEKKKEAKKIGEGPVVPIKEQLTLGQEVQLIGTIIYQ